MREHELAGVGVRPEPRHVREAAGQSAVARQQERVVCQLRANLEDSFGRREMGHQGQFELHERQVGRRQRCSSQPEERDREPVADLDGNHGHDVDQRERGERDAGGEPERAALRRERRRQQVHRVLGVVGERAVRVECGDHRERREIVQFGRKYERPVDSRATAETGDEERGRPADGRVDRGEDEQRGELCRRARGTCP